MIDLKSQARQFKEFMKQLRKKVGDEEAMTLISRAVYLFSIGGNDYVNYYMLPNSTEILRLPPQQFVDVVIGNITTVIQVRTHINILNIISTSICISYIYINEIIIMYRSYVQIGLKYIFIYKFILVQDVSKVSY